MPLFSITFHFYFIFIFLSLFLVQIVCFREICRVISWSVGCCMYVQSSTDVVYALPMAIIPFLSYSLSASHFHSYLTRLRMITVAVVQLFGTFLGFTYCTSTYFFFVGKWQAWGECNLSQTVFSHVNVRHGRDQ